MVGFFFFFFLQEDWKLEVYYNWTFKSHLSHGVSCFFVSENLDDTPSDEEQYYSEDENLSYNDPGQEDDKNAESNPVVHKLKENEGDSSANEKNEKYFKDVKQCKFLKLWLHGFGFS